MAQTAAQRKAAEAKAAETAAEEDEFGSSPETPPAEAPEGSAGGSGAAEDDAAEKVAKAERERDEALNERDQVQDDLNETRGIAGSFVKRLADALGIPEEGEGVDIYDIHERILDEAVEMVKTAVQHTPDSPIRSDAAAAVRLTIEEVDGAGKALRKWGQLVPIAQANPAAVGEIVKRTVEEVVAVPVGPVQALEQQPVED